MPQISLQLSPFWASARKNPPAGDRCGFDPWAVGKHFEEEMANHSGAFS